MKLALPGRPDAALIPRLSAAARRRRAPNCERRSGFSMLELVIVLVIMGLAGSVALPSIGRTLAASKLDQTAAAVTVELQKARTLAGRVRRPMVVSIDAAERRIRITEFGTTTVHSELWLNASSDIGVQSLTTTDATVVVFPNGLADGGVTITVNEHGKSREIDMTRAGQIRTEEP